MCDESIRQGAVALLLGFAAAADAQNKCSATGVMAGEKFVANNCAAAFYRDAHSVTLWFSENPLSPRDIDAFQMSAYANSAKDGKEQTMLLVAFCPGGGQAVASAASIKRIDLGLNHARSPMASAQWVVEAPKDFKVEKISGNVNAGGWDLTFDVTLPAKDAASGSSRFSRCCSRRSPETPAQFREDLSQGLPKKLANRGVAGCITEAFGPKLATSVVRRRQTDEANSGNPLD